MFVRSLDKIQQLPQLNKRKKVLQLQKPQQPVSSVYTPCLKISFLYPRKMLADVTNFGTHIVKKPDVSDCSFVRVTLKLLLHYYANCRSRSLAVFNNKIILGRACDTSDNNSDKYDWQLLFLKKGNHVTLHHLYYSMCWKCLFCQSSSVQIHRSVGYAP